MVHARNKTLSLLMVIMMVLSIFSGMTVFASADTISLWTGSADTTWYTEGTTFTIDSPEKLAGLASLVNGGNTFEGITIKLENNIILNDASSSRYWTPIGGDGKPFKGTFDGQGHSIKGLKINATTSNQGLFGNNAGTIQNVIIAADGEIKVSTSSGSYVGAIAGYNSGTISQCGNETKIDIVKTTAVGGIAGLNIGTISSCYNKANVSGESFVSKVNGLGGIAGKNGQEGSSGTIEGCYNSGTIVYKSSRGYGGITGYSTTPSAIKYCLNVGNTPQQDNYIRMNPIVGALDYNASDAKAQTDLTYTNVVKNYSCEGLFSGYKVASDVQANNYLLEKAQGIVKSKAYMRTADFVTDINNGHSYWKVNSSPTGNCWPVLSWQSATGTIDLDNDNACDICGYATSYTITFAQPENGSIKVTDASNNEITSGTDCIPEKKYYITVTPAAGASLRNVTINGTSQGNASNTIEFTLDSNTVISAEFISDDAIALTAVIGDENVRLNLSELQAYATTKSFYRQGKTDPYEVTGITMSDLYKNYFNGVHPARISFKLNNGTIYQKNSSTVYVDEASYSWDDVMIIWDGSGATTSSLGAAVNGAPGFAWCSSLNGIFVDKADLLFNGIGISTKQLDGLSSKYVDSWKNETTTGSAILLKDCFDGANFKRLGNTSQEPSKYKYILTDGSSFTAPGKSSTNQDFTIANAAIVWGNGLRTSNGTHVGKAYLTTVTEVIAEYNTTAKIIVSPTDALVSVNGIDLPASSNGEYTIDVVTNNTYEVKVSKSGYTPQSVQFTPLLNGDTLQLTLNASGTPGNAVTKPEVIKKEDAIFCIYTQETASSTPKLAASYTKSELNALASRYSEGYVYEYYKGNEWQGIVATKLVKLDELLTDAGVYFGTDCSIGQSDGAGGFSTILPYADIKNNTYFFDPNDNGKQHIVPCGLAIEWEGGSIQEGYSYLLSKARDSGSLRFVVGTTKALYQGADEPLIAGMGGTDGNGKYRSPGYRLGYNITDITVIGEKVSVSTGKVDKATEQKPAEAAPATPEAEKSLDVSVPATVTGDKANVALTDKAVTDAITSAKAESANIITFKAEGTEGAASMKVDVSSDAVTSLKTENMGMAVETDAGSLQYDAASVAVIAEAMSQGATVTMSMDSKQPSELGTAQKTLAEQAKDATIVDINVTVTAKDGTAKNVTDFKGGSVKVTVPYQGAETRMERIAGYFLPEMGGAEKLSLTCNKSDKSFSFEVGHHSTFLLTSEATAAFKDVSLADWFYDSANFVVDGGIMNGMSESEFSPDTASQRTQIVTVLYRMAGSPEPAISNPFTDVNDGDWFCKPVLWAYENGLTEGVSDTEFGTNVALSREQLAAFLMRYQQISGKDVSASAALDKYTDASSVSDWAQDAVKWAVASGIISGMTEDTLVTSATSSRAQMATMMMRLMS